MALYCVALFLGSVMRGMVRVRVPLCAGTLVLRKVGKEGVFGPTVGKFSLHNETSPNGLRLIDFAGAQNMVISSTRFMHKKINQATWLSPDRNTRNQIDYVVIDGRHASSVLGERTIRGPDIDSDHYLVAAKIRTRLNAAKTKEQKTQGKLDVEKLQSQQTANDFATRLSHLLSESTTHPAGIQEQWEHISKALRTAAEEKIGYRRPRKNIWYDAECRVVPETKDAAYRATLKASATRGMCERYRELKKEARRLFRKKAEAEGRKCEELELLATRNNARKFYQKIRRQTEGFKNGANSCRKENGDLVTDVQRVVKLWRQHFPALLQGGSNSSRRYEEPDPAIDDDTSPRPIMTKLE
ncbi:uncharacterized protein [Eurosta solidaginis]|uniref:uncharacterized protein n=1 Tax=Eurosta solidaginis TaxID=178769 RepID=UPI003531464B